MYQRLLVTGVSGYVGLHMAVEGLQRGYIIRGTVRSDKKAVECRNYLKDLVSKQQLAQFEVVTADLTKPDCWDTIIKGCDAIFHVASPLAASNRRDEHKLVTTTREGVKHVFEAAIRQGVTRIVYTSSVAAVMFGHDGSKTHYIDSDWSHVEGKLNTAYIRSKTFTEQDAWRYAENHPELELTSILPGFILGPIIKNHTNLSTGLVGAVMSGAFPSGVINIHFPIVDIRDIVLAHFNSVERKQSIGERIMLGCKSIWMREMAEVILAENPQFKDKINPKIMPRWLLKIFSLYNASLRHLAMEANVQRELSYQKAQDLLEISPRSPEEAVLATAKDLIRLGLVS